MPLHEAKAEIPFADADATNDLLLEREEERWSVLEDVIVRRAWVMGIFDSAADAQASWAALRDALTNPGEVTIRELPDTEWRDSYKAHFHAWQCGRLHWVPVWERESFRIPEGDTVLWLDPGLAFGTGNHETTRLCCERLVAFAGNSASRGRVIDAGCGSGILALSAVKLGFSDVRGFDNDPEAVRISRENAELNGLSGQVTFAVGDLDNGLGGASAELVLANIQADVLMAFANRLLAAVAPGGTLALSGILAQEQEMVRTAFTERAPGWAVESQVSGEWCDVALTRPRH